MSNLQIDNCENVLCLLLFFFPYYFGNNLYVNKFWPDSGLEIATNMVANVTETSTLTKNYVLVASLVHLWKKVNQ